MPRPRPALPSSIDGPVTPAEAHAAGLTRDQFPTAGLVRAHRDIWQPASHAATLEGRCAAALHGLPERSAISHRTAAVLRGLPVPDLPDVARDAEVIHVTVPMPADPRLAGVRVHRLGQPFRVEEIRPGLRVTSAARIWLDMAGELGRVDHVILGDSALNRRLASLDQVAALLSASGGRRGVRVAMRRLPLLEPKADSPMETRLRLLLFDDGLTGFVVNEPIFDDFGDRIGQPDIAFLAPPKLSLQYEGKHHLDPDQWASDIGRDDLMREHGWTILRFVSADIFKRPQPTVYRVRRELELRGYRA